MKYTFEELPQAISTLHEKVDCIKDLLLENRLQNPQRPRDIKCYRASEKSFREKET